MRRLFSIRELMSLQSNAFRCVRCNKFWLDGQPFGLHPTNTPNPSCRHPKLVRTMVMQQPREESPQSRYRRKKRRSRR